MSRDVRVSWLVECCVGIIGIGVVANRFGAGTATLMASGILAIQCWRIGKLKRLVAERHRLSRTDDLTGLKNDRSFREVLNEPCGALILFDLDGFKDFNDKEGHPSGDEALRGLGSILQDLSATFRVGGDEFAVILPQNNSTDIVRFAEAIRRRIEDHSGKIGFITASFGVARAGVPFDPVDLRLRADQALYQAKRLGGNRVVVSADDEL